MSILCEILTEYPSLLSPQDYQPVLKLLADFQKTIQLPIQIKLVTDLAAIMLSKEKSLVSSSTVISEDFCHALWLKIAQLAFRNSASSLPTSTDNLDLLRLLIENKKFESNAFIVTIINAIRNNSIKKSSKSIQLLISVFRTVKLDVLEEAKEMRIGVINWLSPNVRANELKRVIETSDKIDLSLMAELYALCILSKTDSVIPTAFCDNSGEMSTIHDFTSFIKTLEENLQFRLMNKLIVVEATKIDRIPKYIMPNILPNSNLLKSVVVETYYAELEKILHPDDEFRLTENPAEDFSTVATSLATYLNILHHLIRYESLDEDRYTKSFLTKRVQIKVQQMNMSIDALINSNQDSKEIYDMLDKLLNVFKNDLSPLLTKLIIGDITNRSTINWCIKKMMKIRPKDILMEYNSITDASTLSFERRVQLKCLTLLARLSGYDNEDGAIAFDGIRDHEFNFNCRIDLFIVFELIKVIGK